MRRQLDAGDHMPQADRRSSQLKCFLYILGKNA
jgi:hypothetical protein